MSAAVTGHTVPVEEPRARRGNRWGLTRRRHVDFLRCSGQACRPSGH